MLYEVPQIITHKHEDNLHILLSFIYSSNSEVVGTEQVILPLIMNHTNYFFRC